MVKLILSAFPLWVLAALCSSRVSSVSDSFFINCGSSKNISVGSRTFVSDSNNTSSFSIHTSKKISITATDSNSLPLGNDSGLYETARVFSERSSYNFPIKQDGRFFIRLHIFPVISGKYNLSEAEFSVWAQNFTLIRNYKPSNTSVIKEYNLNVTTDPLILELVPAPGSIAFINALEVFRLPENMIPQNARFIGSESSLNLRNHAMETIARVNMGNLTVTRDQDKLWRFWDSDYAFIGPGNIGVPVMNIKAVNFTGDIKEDIAPAFVYGTATHLDSVNNPMTIANVTWNFETDTGFDYFLRLHFCYIFEDRYNAKNRPFFDVFVNSEKVISFDILEVTNDTFGAPHVIDAVMTKARSYGGSLKLSVGPESAISPNAFLNGFEILKVSNEKRSLDVSDVVVPNPKINGSKLKIGLVVGLSATLCVVALFLGLLVFALCRRRRRRRLLQVVHSARDEHNIVESFNISNSKIGYYFPLAVIKEATNNFSDSFIVGVGGFGEVYRGTLKDKTLIAVKRGTSKSQQGFAEFETEIEMLSHFRHRHLVSLIGYCDENNEMIIVYEYMENGTLKNHLYGSDNPSLSWRKRLEICVGAARGLHYLHTSSAKPIIHRDVKSANILLDENFMAKVADFGLSKTGPDLDQTHVSTAVKGSFGYLDPEYLTRQQLTEKSDVYSFGVVMFEVLSGRPVIDPSLPRERVNLIEWAMKLQRNGKTEEIMDPLLVGQAKEEAVKKYCEIAGKCLEPKGVDRPTMGDVLWNLEFILKMEAEEDKTGTGQEIVGVDELEASVTSSAAAPFSVGDLEGVSMSKVFAQMVREEEMR